MWTLILRTDDGIYDIVPNIWLKGKNICVYPNQNFKTTKTMAKDKKIPEDDWDTTEMSIVRKDYGKSHLIGRCLFE